MPGAKSTVAAHPARLEIERQLRAGVPSQKVARDHDLSRQAMDRHKIKLLNKSAGTGDGERDEMRKKIQSLYNSVVVLMKVAQEEKNARKFLASVSEARRCLNLLSKIIGVLNEPAAPVVSVAVNVDVQALQAVILTALVPHPKARIDVAAALVQYADREAGGEE